MLKRILINSLVVFLLAWLMPGIDVSSYAYAILVAVVLGVLQAIVKPLLILFTLPVTVLTFGLFIFVINAIIVLMADSLLSHFAVSSFGSALVFSILLSIIQGMLLRTVEE